MLNQPHQKPPLTVEQLHLLLDADFSKGLLVWKQRGLEMFSSKRAQSIWNARFAGKTALNAMHKDGYKHGRIQGHSYLAHRVLLAMQLGYWPEYVDHINGNRIDNNRHNLREVTKSENGCNAAIPKTNTSGHIGVSWNNRDKRWCAYITLHQKRKALGNFVKLEDAIACRQAGELAYGFHPNHGRIACSVSV